jgi:hypothetical protein
MTPILGIPVYNNPVAGATYENVKIQGLGPWLPTDSVDVWFVKLLEIIMNIIIPV